MDDPLSQEKLSFKKHIEQIKSRTNGEIPLKLYYTLPIPMFLIMY